MSQLAQEVLGDRREPVVNGAAAADAAALENVAAPTASQEFVDDPEPVIEDDPAADAGTDLLVDGGDANPTQDDAAADVLLEALRARNMNIDGYTGDQFIAEVNQTFDENAQLRQQLEDLQSRLASGVSSSGAASAKTPVAVAAQNTSPEMPAWDPPKFDKRMMQFLERDPETQDIRVKPGGDPAILRQYHEYQNWRQEVADRFEQNPGEFIRPWVESITKQIVGQSTESLKKDIHSQTQAEREQEMLHQSLYQNGYLLTNNDGTLRRHPVSNRLVQTPEGTAYLKEYQTLVKEGVPTQRAIDIASRLHPPKRAGSPAPRTAASAGATATNTAAQPQAKPRLTIGDRMKAAQRTPNAARNRAVDTADEDRVPSMQEIQRRELARK